MRFFLFFLMLLFVVQLTSQQVYFKHYTKSDGLPSNQVYRIMQDRNGYIWYSTDYGVCFFNGVSFHVLNEENNLPDNTIFDMYEDYKGRVWFISYSCQLSYFFNDSVYRYKFNNVIHDYFEKKVFPINNSFIVDSNENVFFSIVDRGLFKINSKGAISRYYCNGDSIGLNYIFKNNLNAITSYVVNNICGLYVETNKNRIKLYPKNALLNFFGLYNSLKINDNHFLLGKGKLLFDVQGNEIVNEIILNERINGIQKDNENNVYIFKSVSGVKKYVNGSIVNVKRFENLDKLSITSLLIDKENGYWFSTESSGVFYYPDSNLCFFKQLAEPSFLTSNISRLFIFEDNRICEILGDDSIKENVIDLKCSEIKDVVIDEINKRIFLSTKQYIYQIDSRYNVLKISYNHKEYDCYDKEVKSFASNKIALSKKGGIWIGASTGFFYVDKYHNTVFDSRFDLDFSLRVDAIFEDDTCIWLGTLNGICTFNELTQKITFLSKKSNLFTPRVKEIIRFNKNLWFATKSDGVIVFGDTLLALNKQNGLLSNNIMTMTTDGDNVWIATDKGINKISTLYEVAEESEINKLVKTEINQMVVCNGSLYLKTDDKLLEYKSLYKDIDTIKIPLILTKININDRDTLLLSNYTLPYDKNNILIEFAALTFKDPLNIKYKYILKGFSKQWILTNDKKIHFEYLPSGEYDLYIGIDNYLPENKIKIHFIIEKPFWETWWFRTSIIILISFILSSIIYVYYKKRLSRKEEEMSIKNKLTDDLNKYRQLALNKQMTPHFIFNSLNSIQKYILKNDRVKSSNYLSKFASLMRANLNNSLVNLISIKNEMDALNLYLELESMRFENRFVYEINITDKKIFDYKIPPLLIQPYIENSIWHGIMHKDEQGKILITFELANDRILIFIEDNGIGREEALRMKRESAHKPVGTSLTETRLDVINSLYGTKMTLEYIDLKNQQGNALGTKVIISIPVIE